MRAGPRHPPYKLAGTALPSSRAGLVVDPGSKVTYNGVEIGRVAKIGLVDLWRGIRMGSPGQRITVNS